MDPLSISTSIIALATAAKAIAVVVKSLYDALSKAPKELEALILELNTFASFLDEIPLLVIQGSASDNIKRLQQRVNEAKSVLDTFSKELISKTTVNNPSKATPIEVNRLAWVKARAMVRKQTLKLREARDNIVAEIHLLSL